MRTTSSLWKCYGRRSRTLLCAWILVSAVGCISTWSREVDLNDPPDEDRQYIKAHNHATRDFKIYDNFETKYAVAVTYLSPEFRKAFADRFERLFDAPQPFLEEASNKAGFFVTLFSPEFSGYDITDEQLWTIQLQVENQTLKPSMIRRLSTKERWTPFFVHVHRWTYEYLILFDTPSISLSEQLAKKNTLTLKIANADAKTKFEW